MPYCIVFPGQGTQFPGMSENLDLPDMPEGLAELMAFGPEEQLNLTYNAQPAVLGVSIALWEKSDLHSPDYIMGHSLGEYTALVAAGSITLKEALDLVKKRGEFMHSCPGGAMAAVIGLPEEELSNLVAPFEKVWIANINGAGQIVISGTTDTMNAAVSLLKEKKIKVVPLKVSVASHCPLMENASNSLFKYLKDIRFEEPSSEVIFNTTARTEHSPEIIKDLLKKQLTSTVRWEESILHAINNGVDRFIEIGPKSVLASIIKRIAPGIAVETRTAR